jgi:hypothetical protein
VRCAGWLFPYVQSRALPEPFHPITSYLFLEYKGNLDCWYCWSFDNRVKGMTEDVADGPSPASMIMGAAFSPAWVASPSCARIHPQGCILRREERVLGLCRDQRQAASAGIGRPSRRRWSCSIQLRPGLLGTAAQVCQRLIIPAQTNLEHILRKQYVYDYLVFFGIHICRNNLECEDVD